VLDLDRCTVTNQMICGATGNDVVADSKLFTASCVSMVTTAMVFAIRGDIAGAMVSSFHLTNEQLGLIFSPAFWCFTVAIFFSGAIVDLIGMRALHIASALGYFFGVALIVLAPRPAFHFASIFDEKGTTVLYAGFMVLGLSQGLVEGVVNPLVTTLYSDQKVRRLNMLHAWWPGGLVIGGLLAYALTRLLHASWQLKLATILVPSLIYLVMALLLTYPETERMQSRVSTRAMWRESTRPMFIVLFCCMWFTAALELGPDQWFPTVMGALVPQLQGVLFLVYTSGLIFLLRSFGGSIAHRSPIGTLFVCSALAAAGLFWLGGLSAGASGAVIAFLAATIFGVGKSFLWPTWMKGVPDGVRKKPAPILQSGTYKESTISSKLIRVMSEFKSDWRSGRCCI